MTIRQADILSCYLNGLEKVRTASVYERTGDAVIHYSGDCREILLALARFRYDDTALCARTPENSGRLLNRRYQEKLVSMVLLRVFRKILDVYKRQ